MDTPSKPAASGAETIFRVQGGAAPNASKVRFRLGTDGSLTITGDDMLFVNLGQEDRALEFLAKRGDTAELVRFQVTPEFAARVRAEADCALKALPWTPTAAHAADAAPSLLRKLIARPDAHGQAVNNDARGETVNRPELQRINAWGP